MEHYRRPLQDKFLAAAVSSLIVYFAVDKGYVDPQPALEVLSEAVHYVDDKLSTSSETDIQHIDNGSIVNTTESGVDASKYDLEDFTTTGS